MKPVTYHAAPAYDLVMRMPLNAGSAFLLFTAGALIRMILGYGTLAAFSVAVELIAAYRRRHKECDD